VHERWLLGVYLGVGFCVSAEPFVCPQNLIQCMYACVYVLVCLCVHYLIFMG
jgi:hypothetical protein